MSFENIFYPSVSITTYSQHLARYPKQQAEDIVKDSKQPWGTAFRRRNREEVVLCRLRIGHTRLTHGFLVNHGDCPMCALCDKALMVEHVVVHLVAGTAGSKELLPFCKPQQSAGR